MADPNRDSRTDATATDRGRSSGSSALWLILGAVLVALLLYFFVFSGPEVAEVEGGDSTVIVDEGTTDPAVVVDEDAAEPADPAVVVDEDAAAPVEPADPAVVVDEDAAEPADPAGIVDEDATEETTVEEAVDEETGTTTTITTTVPAD